MMKKSDVISLYSMEELIPIVAKLTEEFTAKESSSVTYERARQFMEAVIYCIGHAQNGDHAVAAGPLSATEAYEIGYAAVVEKVRKTIERYNELVKFFDHYGNQNYRDTVEKALSGFFLYYDAKFAPMDHIITMDYPVFGLDMELEGIDRIRAYMDAIWEEQIYLRQFPREEVIDRLRSFHPHYEREYFNVREIVQNN